MSTRDFFPPPEQCWGILQGDYSHMHFTACKILWHTKLFEHLFPSAECKRRWQPATTCQAVESQHGIVRCLLHLAVTGLDLLTLFPHCPKLAFPFPIVLPYIEHLSKTPFSPQVSCCSWFPFLSCTISFLKSSFTTLSSKIKTISRKTKSTSQSILF